MEDLKNVSPFELRENTSDIAKVKLRKVSEDAKPLRHGSQGAAGYDIRKSGNYIVKISPGSIIHFQTGWSVEMPPGVCCLVLPRSGLSTNKKLRPANTPGLIDSDYRGEIIVALENFGIQDQYISPEDYIAQLLFLNVCQLPVVEVSVELSITDRGAGGFGSTDKH